MGNHSEELFISNAEAGRNATPSDLVGIAVDRWMDGDDWSRGHNHRAGHGRLTRPMTRAHSGRYVDERYEQLFTDAFVIPILDSVEKEKTVKAAVDADLLNGLMRCEAAALEELNERMRAEHGPTVVSATVAGFPKRRKAVATATEGKAVTEYHVVLVEQWNERVVAKGGTQAEARQKALDIINTNEHVNDLEIRAVVLRDSGDKALVRVTRPVPESSTITVNLATSTAKSEKVIGHLVVFSVHT